MDRARKCGCMEVALGLAFDVDRGGQLGRFDTAHLNDR